MKLAASEGFRTIPTWVGRTAYGAVGLAGSSDHPHVGGENAKRDVSYLPARGPSPRGWGERSPVNPGNVPQRTIPTWVGRTSAKCAHKIREADHPHVGGENE